MKKSRFSEELIIGMIKEQEDSVPTGEVCPKHGISTVVPLTDCHSELVLNDNRMGDR